VFDAVGFFTLALALFADQQAFSLYRKVPVLHMASLHISCEAGGIIPEDYSAAHYESPVCVMQVLVLARTLWRSCNGRVE